MSYKIYISASTQKENVGVGAYTNEQDRMMQLADRVKYWLETQNGKYVVERNQKGWTLQQTVADCNSKNCNLFIDNHTNAGVAGAQGTEVFYNGFAGTNSPSYKISKILYDKIAPLSVGIDRGVKPDNSLYSTGLFVVQKTICPATLIEHIWHTNIAEVNDFIINIDKFAKAEAQAVAQYFGEVWIEMQKSNQALTITESINLMAKANITNNPTYWINNINSGIMEQQYVGALLINIGKHLMTKNNAIDILAENKVINATSYFKTNSEYDIEYFKSLILKMGKLLKDKGM